MDESGLEYLRWEDELLNLLRQHGWIESVESNRQDTFVTWTAKGQKCCERFVDEVSALPRDREWTDAELTRLRRFGQYQGLFVSTSSTSPDEMQDRDEVMTGGWREWFARWL